MTSWQQGFRMHYTISVSKATWVDAVSLSYPHVSLFCVTDLK
uniref:Uncharacterized protein n=1 Tax=Anguilla anguilla TaxID=7936 RepID=A0A0E9QWM1_ANGAN